MSNSVNDLSNSLHNASLDEDILIDVEEEEDSNSDSHSRENDSETSSATKVENKKQEEVSTQNYQTDLPTFDFHKFLKQLKDPSANSISHYTKSFIAAFNRRGAWTVQEQIRYIQDFLMYVHVRMRECDVWRDISEREFENAKEGIEKLVLNKLYNATFAPSTTDDKEKDDILHHKISIFRWIREEHLDIPVTEDNESFFTFAQSELLKINKYKAPRDKLICILNCCKVIYGLMKHMDASESADVFLPLLIYVVIRANPDRLISNVQYISRFRSPDHLRAEAGYYLTNLMGAIEFIETMDANSLSISKEEFDANIERTMLEIQKDQPEPTTDLNKKNKINYENALHPILAKNLQPALGVAQKSFQFVEKLFSDSPPAEPSRKPLPPKPEVSLSQPLPVPTNMSTPDLSATRVASGIHGEEARQRFDRHLSSVVAMFPNIEPGVCFMVLQASKGELDETIERLLEMSNDQN